MCIRDRLEPIRELERQGYEVTWLQPDQQGIITAEQVEAALRPDTILVAMMLVNNELGTVLPVAETARAIRAARCPALLHCDAVQGFLKVPFTPEGLGVDTLAVSGHKVHACLLYTSPAPCPGHQALWGIHRGQDPGLGGEFQRKEGQGGTLYH